MAPGRLDDRARAVDAPPDTTYLPGESMRILLIEDDPPLGDGLSIGLRQAGHAVDWLRDGAAADLALKNEEFDCLVLDLGLPRLSGLEVLRRLRQRGQNLPVLILTARDATDDKASPPGTPPMTRSRAWTPAPMTIWSNPSTWTNWRHAFAPWPAAPPAMPPRSCASGT